MQSSDQVENIVQNKVRRTSNKKTLEEMQSALNQIEKEDKIDRTYAILGLIIIIPSLYFAYQYFLA